MNFEERKNLIFRFIACGILLIPIILMVFTLVHVFNTLAEGYVISIVAMMLTIAFAVLEFVVIIKGWKKESNLYNIGFNENGNINNVPLIAVSVGTAFGAGLITLGLVVFFKKHVEPTMTSMLVVISIGSYLLLNCLIYFIYIIMFKKRPLNMKNFIK